MHRQGHLGIVLLALAPVLSVLFTADSPVVALLACSVIVIEPLPDYDLRTSLLAHRKTSHSLLAVVGVGAVCAGLGWALGTYVTMALLPWLQEVVLIGPAWQPWTATYFGLLDARSLSFIGFCVGAGGIILHLLGDVITVSGIQPLLPFSRWTVAPLPLRAASPFVNTLLFVSGIVAFVAVGVMMTPLDEALLAMVGLG